MIESKIVFILGAGASYSYGFPIGSKLVDEIVQFTSNGPGISFLKNFNIGENKILEFSKLLRDSNTPSIDLFIANQTELNSNIAKFSIAKIIGDSNPVKPRPINQNDDWYRLIFNQMIDRFENIGSNNISFITFNYDTSLENFIYSSLRALYSKEDVLQLNKMISQINFIHVYGSIDDCPWNKNDYTIPVLNSHSTFEDILNLSRRIKTIHEGSFDNNSILKAKVLIRNASKIYITGFGYSRSNISILGLDDSSVVIDQKKIIGNSFGLGKAEITDICNLLNYSSALVKENNLNNTQFIKEYVNFI